MRDLLSFQMDADLERETDQAICDICRNVVQDNSDRDQDLWQLRRQLEGVSVPAGNYYQVNSCLLEDPISREMHTTAHANIMSAFRQKPYVTLEALNPAQDDIVQKVEILGNAEADLFGFDDALNGIAYIALESRYAVCEVLYRTAETKQVLLVPKDPAQALIDEDNGLMPEMAPFEKRSVTESFEFNTVDPWDFYLSPSGANDANRADQTVRRIWLTKGALLDGIRNEAFIEDKTLDMVKNGGTATTNSATPRADQMDLQGVKENTAEFYECFRVVGRMPNITDANGKSKIPEEFQNEDFLWLCCPGHGVVFKRTYSPFPVRPYAVGSAIETPGQLIGHGIVSMMSAIQDEMTIVLRGIVDSVDRTMRPRKKIPKRLQGWYSNKDNRNLDYLVYDQDPNEVQNDTYDFAGLQISFELYQMLYGRAQQVAAAQGVNSSMAGKVRKAAEVDFTAEIIQNKFGLILANIQRMVKEIFRIYFALRKYHLTSEAQVRQGDSAVTVTKDDLETEFRIIPHADADNASSQLRLQRDMALWQFLISNPIIQGQIAVGDLSGVWFITNMVLGHMGIQNQAAFIGQQPQPGDPTQILQKLVMIMQQAAAAGHPDAPQVIDFIKQQMSQGNPQMQQEQGQMNAVQSTATPGVGLALPSSPGQPIGSQVAMNGAGGGYH